MTFINFLLMMGGAAQGKEQSPYSGLIFLVLIIAVFYFFMIRPQTKKQKEMKKFRESLEKGDKIVTTGGIYGKIAEVKENYVVIEIEDKVRMKVDKNAVVKDFSENNKK